MVKLDLKLKMVFILGVATSSYRLTAVVAYAALVVTALADTGCAADDEPVEPPSTIVNASDVPLDGLSADDVARFDDGDRLFGVPFRAVDGLGPLYVRTACSSCHAEGGRGPGLVQKMALVGDDGVTPLADQSALTYGHTIREGMAAGATTPIMAPEGAKVTVRVGPPVFGRGYIEAVDDAELIRVEAEQAARGDGIHGKINRVLYASVPNPDTTFGTFATGAEVIGKFGVKARIAMLDDFTADAFQGDMGMTTPMRPTELPNPDGLVDDERARASTCRSIASIASRSICAASRFRSALVSPHAARSCSSAPVARPVTRRPCTRAAIIRRATRRHRRTDLHRPLAARSRCSARRRQHRRHRELWSVAHVAAHRPSLHEDVHA